MSSGWNIMSYNRTRMLDIKMAERAIQGGGGMSKPTGRACAICFKNKREEYFKNKVQRIIDKEQRHVSNIMNNQEREFMIKQFTEKGIVPIEGRLLPDIEDSDDAESVTSNGLDPVVEEEELGDIPVFTEENEDDEEKRGQERRRSFSCNDLSVFSNIIEKLPVKQENGERKGSSVVCLPPIENKHKKKITSKQRSFHSSNSSSSSETSSEEGKGTLRKTSCKLPPLSTRNFRNKLSRSLPNLSVDSHKLGRRPFVSDSTYPFDNIHNPKESQALVYKLTRTLPSEMAGQIATRQYQLRGLEEPLKRRNRLLNLNRDKVQQNALEDPRWRRLADSLMLAGE